MGGSHVSDLRLMYPSRRSPLAVKRWKRDWAEMAGEAA